MLLDYLICGFRNLGRKKFRSFLTISGISIGVSSVILIGSIGTIGRVTIQNELGAMGFGSITVSVDKRFTTQSMSKEDLNLIESFPQVKSCAPVVAAYNTVRMRGLVANTVLWGVNAGESPIISLSPKYGRLLNESDIASQAAVCVVDQNMAEMFYERENIVGKTLEAKINGNYIPLKIVGVVESGGNLMQNMVGNMLPAFAYLPYTTLQQYQGSNTFDQIAITLKNPSQIDSFSQQIEAALNRQHNLSRGFKTDNVSQQKDTLEKILNMITIILSLIAAISLVVAGLGIMTVMVVSVHERTREIGIKKSIGATSITILVEFLIEAFTISLIGSIIGLCTALGLVWFGCLLLHQIFFIDWQLLGIGLSCSIGSGILFGAYPAMIAARLRPVDALRTEI